MRRRTVAISLSVLAAAAGLAGGVAFAASQPDSHPHKAFGCASERAFISDAARRLHVTPTRLTDALKQALIDQIDGAVATGRLPRAQAKTIKRQIEHGPGLPFGPGLLGPAVKAAEVVAPRGLPVPQAVQAPGLFGPPAIVTSAARYLGLTDGQLIQRLRRGESLAKIAKARGKSRSGLERAIMAAVKSQLENALKAGRIPRALELHLLAAFTRHIQDIVTMSGPPAPSLAPGRIRIQVRAGGPPACFAGAIGLMPPPVPRTWIGPPRR